MTPAHRLILAGLFVLLAAAGGCEEASAPEAAIAVPSGREVTLLEVVTDAPGPYGATARFRFLAPGLGEADIATSGADMQALCEGHALERVAAMVPAPQQIIISLSGAVVPFGQAAPGVVQFFEAYRVEGGACVRDPF